MSSISSSSNEIVHEKIKSSLEQILFQQETLFNSQQSDLRILLCFMCGSDIDDVNLFFTHLGSRFALIVSNESGETSFIFNTLVGRTNRKVKLNLTNRTLS